MSREKPRLCWIGDIACATGFNRVTENILGWLPKTWDVHVLGINYYGDPHSYPYSLYPASAKGTDPWGIERYRRWVDGLSPDVVLILNDPWMIAEYLQQAREERIVCYAPVDGHIASSFRGRLDKLDLAIFYTNFGVSEMRRAGYTGPSCVIPHGIDTTRYYPIPQDEARAQVAPWLLDQSPTPFVVGSVARNQPRKRLDLTIQYFTTWWGSLGKPSHVYLWLHCATRDVGWDLEQLIEYYGIADQVIFSNPSMSALAGLPEEQMPALYNSFDVQLSTADGEGWGLTTMEAMACGVPNIVPSFAALDEWAHGGVYYVPAQLTHARPGPVNMIGAVPNEEDVCAALGAFYIDPELRADIGRAGYDLVQQPQYRWETIAAQFDECFRMVLDGRLAQAVRQTRQEQTNGTGPEHHAGVVRASRVQAAT